jgi:hypothetical protein
MIIRRIAFLLCFILPTTILAQEPVQPYDASGRYRTGGLELQLTGAFGQGRDVLLSWGALAVGGGGGRWMQRTEILAGVHAGQNLVDRVMVGPRFSVALAVPGWYVELQRATRAEPYVVLGGSAYGVASLSDEDSELGIAPGISAGIGFRLFDDEWDISLSHVELVVQQRFGVADQAPQAYLRLSRAVPRRRPARVGDPHPDGPVSLPPPPPLR